MPICHSCKGEYAHLFHGTCPLCRVKPKSFSINVLVDESDGVRYIPTIKATGYGNDKIGLLQDMRHFLDIDMFRRMLEEAIENQDY